MEGACRESVGHEVRNITEIERAGVGRGENWLDWFNVIVEVGQVNKKGIGMKLCFKLGWSSARRLVLAGAAAMGMAAPGVAGGQCLNGYRMTVTSGASIVPGTADTGNHCDDCTTAITLPFAFTFYGVSYATANISSNGNIQFASANTYLGNACLPTAGLGPTIFAYQTDLYTLDTASGQGIFSSVSGVTPTRIFNLEWRARYCCSNGAPTENFEVRLYENSSRIDIIYGVTTNPFGTPGVTGLQASATGPVNQFSCATANAAGTMVSFNTCPLDNEYACSDYRVKSTTGATIVQRSRSTCARLSAACLL